MEQDFTRGKADAERKQEEENKKANSKDIWRPEKTWVHESEPGWLLDKEC
jgi:hypothetical protein